VIYCGICNGGKTVREVVYRWRQAHDDIVCVPTGQDKDCPGCDGTGISELAKQQMAAQEK